MLVYRVFAYDPAALPGQPGHPEYMHPQSGKGRLDNPDLYDVWYVALQPEAAVGETFYGFAAWSSSMLEVPFLPNGRRVLGVYRINDSLPYLDLDDARNLLDNGLRPSQVVGRQRSVSQEWARRIFGERSHSGQRKYAVVRWWSLQRPHWTIFGFWVGHREAMPLEFVRCDPLTMDHPAVLDAIESLGKIADYEPAP